MAVPKKRISKSKGGMRRGGNKSYKIKMPNVVIDKKTGEYQLSHHIVKGYYKGKKVIADKKDKKANNKKDSTSTTKIQKSVNKKVEKSEKKDKK